jgi:hypothetical protein
MWCPVLKSAGGRTCSSGERGEEKPRPGSGSHQTKASQRHTARRTTDEHDHNEGRDDDLLQGLGQGPVVTLSHGWPLNSDMWDGQMLFLAQQASAWWHTIVVAMADPARRGPETTWTGMPTIWQP